ncbi:unnamed protein product, partial [Rotaria sp. Silwood2]
SMVYELIWIMKIRNDDIGVANLAFALNRRMNIKLLDCRSQIVFHYPN